MKCPYCGEPKTKIVDSEPNENPVALRRRRQCLTCSEKFTTYELNREYLMPSPILTDTGQGTTVPNLRGIIFPLWGSLAMLSEQTEELIEKVDRLERTLRAQHSDRKLESGRKIQELPQEGIALDEAVKDFENGLILEALKRCNWVNSKAAQLLRIKRTTLLEKIKRKRLAKPSSPEP
jgi:transcriptional repressor NrdR